jgi:hypothetical protein
VIRGDLPAATTTVELLLFDIAYSLRLLADAAPARVDPALPAPVTVVELREPRPKSKPKGEGG